jgi:hypothetical protein
METLALLGQTVGSFGFFFAAVLQFRATFFNWRLVVIFNFSILIVLRLPGQLVNSPTAAILVTLAET